MRYRAHHPNYPLRRAVLFLLLAFTVIVGLVRGCDYIFPAPAATHPHSQVR